MCNKIFQNRFPKTKLYNDKQYINLNNNATSSFPQTLRIYENNSTTKKANNETKYPNPQNGKMTKNKFIESKVPKNRSIYGSQDNYRVAKINYDGKIEKCDKFHIPSPDVPTYDLKPEMSCIEVTKKTMQAMMHDYDFILVNFANPDMVGHTGNMDAATKACVAIDVCLNKIMETAEDNF